MISEKEMMYDKDLTDMFVAGRHYFLNVHITTQYPKAIPPRIRDNADYVFIFKSSSPANRGKLYEDYGGNLTKAEFYYLLDTYTKDFNCLVFRNRLPEEKYSGAGASQGAGKKEEKVKEAIAEQKAIQKVPEGELGRIPEPEEAEYASDPEALSDDLEGPEVPAMNANGVPLDPDRFKAYFYIRYPYPIPTFRIGSDEEWKKQDEERYIKACTIYEKMTRDATADLAKPADSDTTKVMQTGASGWVSGALGEIVRHFQPP
jgi:hypothetical protein